MKNIILGAIAAFALSACVTAADVDKDEQMDAAQAVEMKADKKTMECAVPGPNDTCACKKVDANGDCVEGGGPAVIIQRQSVCAVPAPDGSCACEVLDANGDCVEGGGPGVIVQGGNSD
jgi:opacity protein-like surface antigen